MFDTILNKIKECVDLPTSERLTSIGDESVIVKLTPKSYDGSVCVSRLEVVSVAKSYERALVCFDKICDGLDTLPSEDNDVLDVTLDSTVIKYDTVSGMTRLFGIFKCYTEVQNGGIE